MSAGKIPELYHKYLVDLGFERAGLFAVLQKTYGPREALYPGCSIHVTPSFYFPHVVYVDQSEMSATFFADPNLPAFVLSNRHYRRSPHLHFIHQDYTLPLPLAEKFDLLIALNAGGVIQNCLPYVADGGLVLANDFQGNAAYAARHPRLKKIASLRKSGKSYRILSADVELPEPEKRKPDLVQTHRGLNYREEADTYWIFEVLSVDESAL